MIFEINLENIGKSGDKEFDFIKNTGWSELFVLNKHPLEKTLDTFHENLLQPFEFLRAGRSTIFSIEISLVQSVHQTLSSFK